MTAIDRLVQLQREADERAERLGLSATDTLLVKLAADSLAKASTHEKVGHTEQGLWHHKGWQLPAYIQHIANDLMEKRGMDESRAVHMAVGLVQKWARGGGKVDQGTQAAAKKALAEWETLKAKAAASHGAKAGKKSS